MSLKKFALAAAAVTALALPSTANAASDYGYGFKLKRHNVAYGNVRTRGIDNKIENHQRRIRKGRIQGDLTFREVRRLRRGLNRIRKARYYAKADGRVTRFERRELRTMLANHSKRIYRLRHNRKTANRHFLRFSKKFY